MLIVSTSSVLEGEIVRSRLEAEGIPVLLKGAGVDPYRTGPTHVFVPAGLEVQARLVLESLETKAADIREDTSDAAGDDGGGG
jgi:hypothetical protein